MTLKDIIPTLVGSDRLIIKTTDNTTLYHGFRGLLEAHFPDDLINSNCQVTRITYFSDLKAKDWQSKGYTAPIDPNTTTDYDYKDLEQRIYLEITLDISNYWTDKTTESEEQ